MADTVQIQLKTPRPLADRIDNLVPTMAQDPALAAFGRVTRASVARLALARGVEVLEEEYLEDQADIAAAEEALKEPGSIPLAQVKAELGLD